MDGAQAKITRRRSTLSLGLLVCWLPSLVVAFCPTLRTPLHMVEGHGCHRVVAAHRRLLLGHVFKASSPNGRFTEGARLIDGRRLARIEAVGKNLFYWWEKKTLPKSEPPVVIHIHFGMSGAFSVSPLPGKVTPTTRLRLVNTENNLTASLSAMTLVHGGADLYATKYKGLGPDPLREDADKERLWAKMQQTSKPIGQVLMDQSCVAGIGNIYRAEICFKSKVHPEQPARTVPRATFETLWMHSVVLLQRGFKSGSILTVDPAEAVVLGPPWTRRYIYNHESCGRCGTAVQNWQMAGRTVYACPTCQPLLPETELQGARKKALAMSTGAKEFVSHCAGEDAMTLTPSKMTVAVLRAKLEGMGLPVAGRKADLVARLVEAVGGSSAVAGPVATTPQKKAKVEEDALLLPVTPVKPGTLHLGQEASARRAAREKRRAGENRAVEHVALHDEEEAAEIASVVPPAKKRATRATKSQDGTQQPKKIRAPPRRESSAREWAAEVAVPGSVGLMDEILLASSTE